VGNKQHTIFPVSGEVVVMKKFVDLSLILALVCVGCTAVCGGVSAEEMQTFVDDVGREVVLPAEIKAVSPSGPLAQIVLYSLDPELFASVASKISDNQKKYIDPKLLKLPVTGRIYGGSKGSTIIPALIAPHGGQHGTDVVLDVGEKKEMLRQDLDDIQSQTGVPFVFITQETLADIPASYQKLGKLLSCEEQSQRLSDYIASLLREFDVGMAKIGDTKKSLAYVTKIDGDLVSMVGKDSYHSDIVDFVGTNVVPSAKSSRGIGDDYKMKDLLNMNPDFIIVSSTPGHASYYKILNECQSLSAVKNGNVYEAPNGPYNWMGMLPSAQRLLSLIWLGNLMYPDVFDYSVDSRVMDFYSLFFHYDLTDADLSELMIYAKPGSKLILNTDQILQ